MASNGFFEFLGDLRSLYDEASRRRNWAQQYNPYNGGNTWFRGLGAINQMMDRNAEDRALKAQRQAYKKGTGNPSPVGVGADANGVYGVGQSAPSVSVGSYANDATPQSNKFSFNESDYIPSEQNGYHLGDYPQTEMYGDPKDFQRQMASNAIGYDLGSFEPRQQKWFTPSGNSGSVGFSSVFGGNNFSGGSLVNPKIPSTSSDSNSLAREIGGQNSESARDLSQYLSDDYNVANWMQADEGRGVDNPYISMLRYATKIAPLREQARQDDLRNAFATYNNPKATPEERNNAIAKLEFYLKRPGLGSDLQRREDEYYAKRGMMRNPDLSDVDSEYGGDNENARTIYAHLASKGLPANVIAGIMGNLQQESGFDSNAYNPNDGDGSPSGGIAQWHASRLDNLRNFASQRGSDWNNLGTQLDFLLQEMNDRDPSLVQRMAKLSPHEAALLFHKEFEISNDTPEQAAQRGINASNIFNGRRQKPRYVRDPNFVSPKEKFDAEQAYKDRLLGLREYRINNGNNPYGKQLQKMQENYNKNVEEFRQNSMDLSNFDNITEDDEKGKKAYEESMNKLVKNVKVLCDAYKESGSKMNPTQFGIALYHELNEDPTGLTPEQLAEAVAKAVAVKRGGVDPNKLYDDILNEVYGRGKVETKQPDKGSTGTKDRTEDEARNRRNDMNYDGVYILPDGRRVTEDQYNRRQMLMGKYEFDPRYEEGTNPFNGTWHVFR